MDETDVAISRHSSRRFQWGRQSSELRHSMRIGLKLAKASESMDESPPEALSFVTFKDGRHRLREAENGQDFV